MQQSAMDKPWMKHSYQFTEKESGLSYGNCSEEEDYSPVHNKDVDGDCPGLPRSGEAGSDPLEEL